MSDQQLDSLASLQGLGRAYYDYKGELKYFSDATRIAILHAMGVTADDPRSVANALLTADSNTWNTLLAPLIVLNPADAQRLVLTLAEPKPVQEGGAKEPGSMQPSAAVPRRSAQEIFWSVELEEGGTRTGSAMLGELRESERRETPEKIFSRRELILPPLPLGYHRLRARTRTATGDGPEHSARLIVAPLECYQPDSMVAGRKLWGVSIQLYTLRSAGNWGMGDFADLMELIRVAAPLGCSLIGLNPLHALMPANPAHSSPYSPSSRLFLNVLYISVPLIPEFAACRAVRDRCESAAWRAQVAQLQSLPRVDYPAVAALKLPALHELHQHFRIEHLARDTARAAAFREFVVAQGEPLLRHALYDSLNAMLRGRDPSYWGWPVWPEPYRDVNSAATREYAKTHAADVEFYLYLQWLAAEQLDRVRTTAREHGMALGLYGDLAVGANPGGSECWANPNLYLHGVSVGAPPDPLALLGQSWGLPPQDPRELQRQEYEPFIHLLRNAMRAAAAIRLDHVMALFRLWLVPSRRGANEGAYVHYPLHDLISILALESVRNRCIVIGEDLGTVPDEMRAAMQLHELLHYKVLLFERNPDGSFKLPQEYASRSLATVTTHDMPTLHGWWSGEDLRLRDRLNLFPDVAMRTQLHGDRETEKRQMMRALVRTGLWHWQEHEAPPEYSHALSRAIHLYLGTSQAALMTLQLEDLLGMTDPVNVPGTDKEHPNWQRKLTAPVGEILGDPQVRELLAALNGTRR